jgi:outer membrane lipoprotein-sorting protein
VRFLRTTSTRTLLALIAGSVVVIGAGTAIAVAASSGGPVPRPEALAQAVRGALGAPTVKGISARITFTNHLIDAADIQGADPLLQGAAGRLWFSPSSHQLRAELQSDNGDAQVVVNNRSFWVYDPASNTVYEGSLPTRRHEQARRTHETLPSLTQIQTDLNKLAQHLNLSGAIPGDVAGQPTYTVRFSPKRDGGLLGNVALAWDALRGVPLRLAIYARGDSSPVLELKAADISYGAIPASDFAVTPPSGAKVVKLSTLTARHATVRKARLPFALVAPKSLAGRLRESVRRLGPAALVSYRGGIVVLEQSARSRSSSIHSSHLSLPTVSIGGSTGQELATALGTVIRFTRGHVSYTVLGSVTPAAAEAAARAL